MTSPNLDPARVKVAGANLSASIPVEDGDFEEVLNSFLKEHLLEIPTDSPFFDTDVVVFKNYEGTLPSNAMTEAEFEEATNWLNELKKQRSIGSLKIEGDEPFCHTIYDNIKILCQRKSGRELLSALLSFPQAFTIRPTDALNTRTSANVINKSIYINSKSIGADYVLKREDRKKHPSSSIRELAKLQQAPLFITLAHEMIHLLHGYLSEKDSLIRGNETTPSNLYIDQFPYSNMEEFLTITGWGNLSLEKLKIDQIWDEKINETRSEAENWDMEDSMLQSTLKPNNERWEELSENGFRAAYSIEPRLGHGGLEITIDSPEKKAFFDAAEAGDLDEMQQIWDKHLSVLFNHQFLNEMGRWTAISSEVEPFKKLCDLAMEKNLGRTALFLNFALQSGNPLLSSHVISKASSLVQSKTLLNANQIIGNEKEALNLLCFVVKHHSVETIKKIFSQFAPEMFKFQEVISRLFISALYNDSIDVSRFIQENYSLAPQILSFPDAYKACIECHSVEKAQYVASLDAGHFKSFDLRILYFAYIQKKQDVFFNLLPHIATALKIDANNVDQFVSDFSGHPGVRAFPLKFFLKIVSAQKTSIHALMSVCFFIQGEKSFASEFIKPASPPTDHEKLMIYRLFSRLDPNQASTKEASSFIADNKLIEIPTDEQKETIEKALFAPSFKEVVRLLQEKRLSMVEPYWSGVPLLVLLGECGKSDPEALSAALFNELLLSDTEEKKSKFWTIIQANPHLFHESVLKSLEEKMGANPS